MKNWFLLIGIFLMAIVIYIGIMYLALTGNRNGGIPKPEQYDMSGLAPCTRIIEYEYDEDDRLMKRVEYSYSGYVSQLWQTGDEFFYTDHVEGAWRKRDEFFYYYDSQGRLILTEHYVPTYSWSEPYNIMEYEYDDDGYSKKSSTMGKEDYTQIYDIDDNILADIRAYESDTFYYYYNENGDLSEVKYGYGDVTAATFLYDYDNSVSIEGHSSGSYYVLWLDHYDENKNRVSSYWYTRGYRKITNEYSSEEIESLSIPSYDAHYNGNKLIDAITANEWVRNLKDTYSSSNYELCDYDEAGRILWHYRMVTSSTQLYAYHYVYDGGKPVRALYYTIEGDWQHTLYDGTTVELRREDEGKLIDLTRYDAAGNVMYSYIFHDNGWGARMLHYTLDAKGDVLEDWTSADKSLAELNRQEYEPDDGGSEDGAETKPDDKAPDIHMTYYVRKGDCLWSIAEELLGNGNRWREIYDTNRAVIGENPSIIYEGTELKIIFETVHKR